MLIGSMITHDAHVSADERSVITICSTILGVITVSLCLTTATVMFDKFDRLKMHVQRDMAMFRVGH